VSRKKNGVLASATPHFEHSPSINEELREYRENGEFILLGARGVRLTHRPVLAQMGPKKQKANRGFRMAFLLK